MESRQGLPVIAFSSAHDWENWLEAGHAGSKGVWMKIAKKGTGIESVTHADALERALCFGWIDGQRVSYDERFFLQKFTPRGPRSKWSRLNREKALELVERGRMRPAGLARIDEAREDGRWDAAYEPQSSATVPEDLQRALDDNPRALAFFETLDSRNRYAILFRIHDAKKPETRARRIDKFVSMLNAGEKLYP